MTPLGHPEAHELLLDLALEPSALAQVVQATLGGPALPDGDPLVAHLQACAICQEQLVAWTRTHAAVREALHQAGSAVPQRLEPWDEDTRILPPPDLRAHVLEAARTASMTSTVAGLVGPDLETTSARTRLPALTSITQGRRFTVGRVLPLVAALVVLLAGARVVVDRTTQLDQARRDVAALEAVSAATERLLRDPSHRVVELTTTTGGPGGSISWSAHDFVVLTSVLVPPPEGQVYRCWIERDGTRSPVGQMAFAGLTAFWYGSLYEWATTSFGSGVFGVSLEPASGPEGHPPVLSGNLGS